MYEWTFKFTEDAEFEVTVLAGDALEATERARTLASEFAKNVDKYKVTIIRVKEVV